MKIYIFMLSLLFINVSHLTSVSSSQELTFITENAPPNAYIENNTLTGKAVETVQAVMKEIGMEGCEIKIYPWARGYKMLETRENIVLFPTSRTHLRENLFKWAGPISDNEVNIYKLKSRTDIQPLTLEDLQKYSIGSGRNDQKTQYLLSHGFTVQTVSEDKQNIDKLFAGRVEIILYSASRLRYDVKKYGHNPSELEKIWNIEEISTQNYVAFSKSTDDSLVKKFQEGFNSIKAKGIHEKILKKWE